MNPPSFEEMAPVLALLERQDRAYVREVRRSWETAREFAKKIRERALEIDEKVAADHTYFDWDLVRAGLPYRLLSAAIPVPFGGRGRLAVDFALMMEELCAACAGVANIFGAHALGMLPLLVSGSLGHGERQLREVADAEARGEPILFALAITEPGAGSDVEDPEHLPAATLSGGARRVDGGYLLNGRKCFISNGSVAKYVTVAFAADRGRPLASLTWFLVERGRKGFSVGRVEEKMGQRACPAAELVFDDVFVPDENVIGFEGEGMDGTLLGLGASRGPVGAIGTGIARGALEWFVDFAENTRRGGKFLIDEPHIGDAVAEMAARIAVARQAYLDAALQIDFFTLGRLLRHPAFRAVRLVPKAARSTDTWFRLANSDRMKRRVRGLVKSIPAEAQTRATATASLAKIVGSDAAMFVTTRALELVGPEDTVHRRWIEKCFRDAKLTQIYEGTNQINRAMYLKTAVRRTFRVEPFRTTS